MAFATANTRGGTVGNLKMLAGDWSGSVGDAAGTITLSGGRVYLCHFENQDSDGTKQTLQPSVSISNGSITITVGNYSGVTDGRFVVIYA